MAKSKAARQRRYEKAHIKSGLCRVCPKAAARGCYCYAHWKAAYDARRKRNGCKKKYKVH